MCFTNESVLAKSYCSYPPNLLDPILLAITHLSFIIKKGLQGGLSEYN